MIKRALPHLCLVCSVMMVVFYFIDRYNKAMHFIGGNEVFNSFLLIFSLLVIASSLLTIIDQRQKR